MKPVCDLLLLFFSIMHTEKHEYKTSLLLLVTTASLKAELEVTIPLFFSSGQVALQRHLSGIYQVNRLSAYSSAMSV